MNDTTPALQLNGPGSQSTWLCMGCNRSQSNLGAKGKGIRRRCASCLAAAAARKKAND